MARGSYSPRVSLCISVLLVFAVFGIPTSSPAQDASHSPGWVVIPVYEYRALRLKAFPLERDLDPPPVEATLTRVDYELQISGDLATGRASLTVDVLKDGWVRVPIPEGLLVSQARLDGKLLSLVSALGHKEGSQLSALLSHHGQSYRWTSRFPSHRRRGMKIFRCLRPDRA
jgi:hypothetical protein